MQSRGSFHMLQRFHFQGNHEEDAREEDETELGDGVDLPEASPSPGSRALLSREQGTCERERDALRARLSGAMTVERNELAADRSALRGATSAAGASNVESLKRLLAPEGPSGKSNMGAADPELGNTAETGEHASWGHAKNVSTQQLLGELHKVRAQLAAAK